MPTFNSGNELNLPGQRPGSGPEVLDVTGPSDSHASERRAAWQPRNQGFRRLQIESRIRCSVGFEAAIPFSEQ
jgi:hypothetical protein